MTLYLTPIERIKLASHLYEKEMPDSPSFASLDTFGRAEWLDEADYMIEIYNEVADWFSERGVMVKLLGR